MSEENLALKQMMELFKTLSKDIADRNNLLRGIEKEISDLEKSRVKVKEMIRQSGGVLDDIDETQAGPDSLVAKRTIFPKSGTFEEKVISVIKMTGRAMQLRELKDKLLEIDASNYFNSFSYHIQKMFEAGQIVMSKVGDSNKHTYYAIPEFLERRKLKIEHLPSKETWGNFSEEKIHQLCKKPWPTYEETVYKLKPKKKKQKK